MRQRFLSRFLAGIAPLTALAAFGLPALAQVPDVKSKPGLADQNIMDEIKTGKAKPSPASAKAFKGMAEYYAYKLAHPPLNQENLDPKKPPVDTPSTHIEEFKTRFFRGATGTKQLSIADQAYLVEVAKAMDVALKFVLDNDDRPVVKLNAVRFMAEMAKAPYPPMADTFVKIITDKQKYSDAYKNYAFQGLRNLLTQKDPESLENMLISQLKDAKREAAIANALSDVVLKPDTFSNQPREVAQFIRRNAIAALGAVPDATVFERRDQVLARPALALYKVITGDPAIQPPPSPAEKVEATMGLMTMRMEDPNLNLDVLAYALNNAVLDMVTVQGDNAASKLATVPWKYTAGRMSAAIAAMKANGKKLKNDRDPKWILDLVDRLAPLAAAVEEGGRDAKPEIGLLTDWQATRKPKAESNGLLYKDVPESGIAAPAPAKK